MHSSISFTGTFDVQSGSVSTVEGLVCFQCVFITGSGAVGCYVQYKDEQDDVIGSVTINRTDSEGCIASTASISSAVFYDIESDGVISDTEPAYRLVGLTVSPVIIVQSTPTITVSIGQDDVTPSVSVMPTGTGT